MTHPNSEWLGVPVRDAFGHVDNWPIFSASRSINTVERKRYWNRTFAYFMCRSVCLFISRPVKKEYCGKTADWIRMPFGVVSGVGRGMCVLDGVRVSQGKGWFDGVFVPIYWNGVFLTEMYSTRA